MENFTSNFVCRFWMWGCSAWSFCVMSEVFWLQQVWNEFERTRLCILIECWKSCSPCVQYAQLKGFLWDRQKSSLNYCYVIRNCHFTVLLSGRSGRLCYRHSWRAVKTTFMVYACRESMWETKKERLSSLWFTLWWVPVISLHVLKCELICSETPFHYFSEGHWILAVN